MGKKHAITLLTRLAKWSPGGAGHLRRALQADPETLVPVVVEVAVETGDPAGQVLAEVLAEHADPALAVIAAEHIPLFTTSLLEAAVVAFTRQLEATASWKGADPDAYERSGGDLGCARAATRLVTFLNDLGRHQEALSYSVDALGYYERGYHLDPNRFRVGYAMALNTLAATLRPLGAYERALGAARRALALRQREKRRHPENPANADLTFAVGAVAALLIEVSRFGMAHRYGCEAVRLYRGTLAARAGFYAFGGRDAKAHHAAQLADVAFAASKLGLAGAAESAEASVELFRDLAEAQEDAYSHELARALSTAAATYTALSVSQPGARERALAYSAEAVALMERPGRQRPEAFTAASALGLRTRAAALLLFGEPGEAEDVARRAVTLGRSLVSPDQPAKGRLELALSLDLYASCLAHRDQAVHTLSHEALTVFAPLLLEQPSGMRLWAAHFIRNYRHDCEGDGVNPDWSLLDPLLEALRPYLPRAA